MHGNPMGILGSLAIIPSSSPTRGIVDPRHPRAKSNNSEAWSDGESSEGPGDQGSPAGSRVEHKNQLKKSSQME